MASASADEKVTLGGFTWATGKSHALLQGDHLHPSRRGLAALAIATLEMAATHAALPVTSIQHDLETIVVAAIARGKEIEAAGSRP